jgi:hypothetical protein
MTLKDILLFLFFMVLIFVGMSMGEFDRSRVVKYDCRISEISPDIPIEVKEACRRMRAERVK